MSMLQQMSVSQSQTQGLVVRPMRRPKSSRGRY